MLTVSDNSHQRDCTFCILTCCRHKSNCKHRSIKCVTDTLHGSFPFEELTVSQPLRKFVKFCGIQCSLPYTEQTVCCPYCDSHKTSQSTIPNHPEILLHLLHLYSKVISKNYFKKKSVIFACRKGNTSMFFLGVFAKLRKATISFVLSVLLSVRPHGITLLLLDGFSPNLKLISRCSVKSTDNFTRYFLGAFAKLRKTTISFMSVCPSARNNSAPTGQIMVKLHI